MIKAGLSGVEYIVANTDARLNSNLALTKVQLGADITKAAFGANPEIGRKAALDEYEKLSEVIEGSDMVYHLKLAVEQEPVLLPLLLN